MGDYGYIKVELVYNINFTRIHRVRLEKYACRKYFSVSLCVYTTRCCEHRYCVNPSFITDLIRNRCNIVNKRKVILNKRKNKFSINYSVHSVIFSKYLQNGSFIINIRTDTATLHPNKFKLKLEFSIFSFKKYTKICSVLNSFQESIKLLLMRLERNMGYNYVTHIQHSE